MDEPSDRQPRAGGVSCGVVALALLGGLIVLAFVLALAVPFFMPVSRVSNTRNASASLKTITTAQADFRSNDRDGNRVNDFWTADVYALWALVPVGEGQTEVPGDTESADRIIKLIEPSMAGADGFSRTGSYGNLLFRSGIIEGSPKAGYVYRMFARDGTVLLAEDTDGPALYGAVHHGSRFACASMPHTLSAGKLFFIVNADNTIWYVNLPRDYRLDYKPMQGTSDSTSTVSGTGRAEFDFGGLGTGAFPADPRAGCAKMD